MYQGCITDITNILKSTYDEILKSNGIKVAPVVEVIDGKPVKRAGTKSASKTWKIIFEAGSRTVERQPQKIYTSFSLVIPSYLGIIGYAKFIGSTLSQSLLLSDI